MGELIAQAVGRAIVAAILVGMFLGITLLSAGYGLWTLLHHISFRWS